MTDINRDGFLDLISVGGSSYVLTVLTNTGTGSFRVSAVINDIPEVWATVADLRGTGNIDLVLAGNGLVVLTNDGAGNLSSYATLPTDGFSWCVAAADLNGDGSPDLVSANYQTNTITVLTNNGSGVFATSATLTVGPNPYFVVAADINGDKSLDLVTANSGTNTLTVLTNDGAGGFSICTTLTVGDNPRWVTAADVNDDGRIDLISANYRSHSLTVLTNRGSSAFGLNTNLALSASSHVANVVAADFNGDHNTDFAAGDSWDYPYVFLNDGRGGFRLDSAGDQLQGSFSLTVADINADGKPDLIGANFARSQLMVALNTATLPKLTVTKSAKAFLVSWPYPSTGWTLRSNSDISATNWQVCGPILNFNPTNLFRLSQPTGTVFYRLFNH